MSFYSIYRFIRFVLCPVYLCLFDNELNKIKEIKLPINTFNPYTGWCQIHDGILFFVDKITDQEISEDLEVHIFHPVMIKND